MRDAAKMDDTHRSNCQNICSRLTAFRLEQIEHFLSRYVNDISCVVSAEEAVVAGGRISCSSSHRSHVTINPGQSPSADPPAEMGMILTLLVMGNLAGRFLFC